MTKIAFTGTQKGMTDRQLQSVREYLQNWKPNATEFHHGDCVGADAQAHEIAMELGYTVHIHPCNLENKRAFCEGGIVHPVNLPLPRNRDIVKRALLLIACPRGMREVQRSGTWYTIRKAKASRVPIATIYPAGNMEWYNGS